MTEWQGEAVEITPDMGNVYTNKDPEFEQWCRRVLMAGIEWLNANPGEEPIFTGVPGFAKAENPAAEGLTRALYEAEENFTIAQHYQIIQHLLFIRNYGWNNFAERVRERERKEKK